jgi:hypothetical protein
MSRRTRWSRLLVLLSASVAVLLPATAAEAKPNAHPQNNSAVVLDWYDITTQTVAAAAYPEQVTQSRAWAVSWLAAARAVKAGGSPALQAAALATALHDTLATLVPSRQVQLDGALASTLDGIAPGREKDAGAAAGRGAAAAILSEREGDGLDAVSVDRPWSPPAAAPGVWQPTPPSFDPAVRAGQGEATPFLLAANDQFRPGAPPALDSPEYLSALAEVHDIGSAGSTSRTPQQTDVARFWAQSSYTAYVQVLRGVVASSQRPLAWATRLVASFHAITVDAQIAIYDAKYTYVFWRPVTAIRANGVTGDSDWTPLIATPRHPEYPSGHAGYAGAAQAVFETLVGPHPVEPIDVTSATAPGSTHTFSEWPAITQENIDGRVWEGIHFRFSDETGADVGRRVARYELRNLSALGI